MDKGLVRFGIAMEPGLLEALDLVVAERGGSRSELIRDLVRAEISRTRVREGASAVAALTLVYDHHVRDLTERITEFQHALGDRVRCTTHVHLDHDHCLEVIVMRGASGDLRRASERLLATRGVTHGGVEMIEMDTLAAEHAHREHAHHEHTHEHDGHVHSHTHAHVPVPARPAGAVKRKAAPKRR